MPKKFLFLFLLLILVRIAAIAQTIQGNVIDMEDKEPINNVDILNIHTGFDMLTDNQGKFFIAASKGQLLEFRKMGYKTVRVRVPDGYIPSFFKIIMQKGMTAQPPQYVQNGSKRYDYTEDSIRFHDIYKHELDFARMSTLDEIQHPFSALSKKSREIWAFQDDYKYTEQQKYIDNTFNAKIISDISGLKGDSVLVYMKRYRPTYEQLRSMNDYAFYNFIKWSVELYRERSRSTSRSSQ